MLFAFNFTLKQVNRDLSKKVLEAIKTKCMAKHIDTMIKALKCTVTVTGRLIGDSDLKKEYETFKTKIEKAQNDITQCSEINDVERLAL